MSEPNIILDPKLMFILLGNLQEYTKDLIRRIQFVFEDLQEVANFTYAIGFGELVKKAETEINQVATGVVTANNTIFNACKDVVNELVNKFAPQGAKSDYSAPQFTPVQLKVNPDDQVTIYPQHMRDVFSIFHRETESIGASYYYVQAEVADTKKFWVGTSADKFRQTFDTKIGHEHVQLNSALINIYVKGNDWIEKTIQFEKNLPTP